MPGKPFSNKQKKEQLQKKREKKRNAKGLSTDHFFIYIIWNLLFQS